MASFTWDPLKNGKLIRERGVSFEAIVASIQSGGLLDVLENPNAKKYPGQRILVVQAFDYAFLVPCEEQEGGVRLITIIPSRKAFRKYVGRGGRHGG